MDDEYELRVEVWSGGNADDDGDGGFRGVILFEYSRTRFEFQWQADALLGFGTAASPPVGSQVTKAAILQATELGYRHFDTACLYGTERPLGEAIAEAVSVGLIKSRYKLFIASKLWCSDAHGELVLPALHRSLKNLGMEYLDLYLIHWPLRVFCKENDILLTAYAPLEAQGTIWGTNRVLECELLKEIAKEKGKTVAQICLRWGFEQGVSILVKSLNKMKSNLEIFNLSLSQDELRKIDDIPQTRICCGEDYISKYVPFKTKEELWDGEI
ncbi:NADPH-dependent codeinone reductase 1-4 [Hibiscus syriacus]|uniref:NADPH-dependent codeinone reductase 1-4 n=1 Tax=Hibiscus syriacus TaxID=106335 RepID=A0A6A3CSR9_HIBSY|nr:NADPH-dependent codeinone reductase 1-4 [Hibiscus syriacus]